MPTVAQNAAILTSTDATNRSHVGAKLYITVGSIKFRRWGQLNVWITQNLPLAKPIWMDRLRASGSHSFTTVYYCNDITLLSIVKTPFESIRCLRWRYPIKQRLVSQSVMVISQCSTPAVHNGTLLQLKKRKENKKKKGKKKRKEKKAATVKSALLTRHRNLWMRMRISVKQWWAWRPPWAPPSPQPSPPAEKECGQTSAPHGKNSPFFLLLSFWG